MISRWAEQYRIDHPPLRGNQHQDPQYVDSYDRHDEEWMIVLAHHCGTSTRTIRRILHGGYSDQGRWVDYLGFDLADKIVIGCFGVLEWHTNADLAPYYGPLEVTVGERRAGYELPEMEEAHAA